MLRASLAAASGPLILASVTPKGVLAHSGSGASRSGSPSGVSVSEPSELSEISDAGTAVSQPSDPTDSLGAATPAGSKDADLHIDSSGPGSLSAPVRILLERGLRTGDLVMSDDTDNDFVCLVEGESKHHVPGIPTVAELLACLALAGVTPDWRVIHHADLEKLPTAEPEPVWGPENPGLFDLLVESIIDRLGDTVAPIVTDIEPVDAEDQPSDVGGGDELTEPDDPDDGTEPETPAS